MAYYKITYESNSLKGLKAIQASFADHGANATDLTASTSRMSPPPQPDKALGATLSDVVPAPPPAANAGLGLSDETAFYPPPPAGADPTTKNSGLEGQVPPPPIDELLT